MGHRTRFLQLPDQSAHLGTESRAIERRRAVESLRCGASSWRACAISPASGSTRPQSALRRAIRLDEAGARLLKRLPLPRGTNLALRSMPLSRMDLLLRGVLFRRAIAARRQFGRDAASPAVPASLAKIGCRSNAAIPLMR